MLRSQVHLASVLEFPLGQVTEQDLGPSPSGVSVAGFPLGSRPLVWSAEEAERVVGWGSWVEAAGGPLLTQSLCPCSALVSVLSAVGLGGAGHTSVSHAWHVFPPVAGSVFQASSHPTRACCWHPSPQSSSHPSPTPSQSCEVAASPQAPFSPQCLPCSLCQDVWCGLADGGGPLGHSDRSVLLWRTRAALTPCWGQASG